MKNKLELMRYRKSLKDFFKNVIDCPGDEVWREKILDWVVKLYEFHDISIPNFEYLFKKCKDVSFPVQYDSSSPRGLIDSSGNKFYFLYQSYYTDMNVYTIGKKDASFEIYFDFKLLPIGAIVVYRMCISLLDNDASKKNPSLTFEYDENFTNVSLDICGNKLLTLSYPKQNQDFDTKLANYLFTLVGDNFHDVIRIFITIACMIPDIKNLNVTSFDETGEILSQVIAANGLVEKYLFTIATNRSLSCMHKLTPLAPISNFIKSPTDILKDLM